MKSIEADMKTNTHTVRVMFWAMLGIAVMFTNLAIDTVSPAAQETTPTPLPQILTIIPETGAQDEAGSTDGIMFIAVLILLVIIVPILLKRREWENGRKNKSAPSN